MGGRPGVRVSAKWSSRAAAACKVRFRGGDQSQRLRSAMGRPQETVWEGGGDVWQRQTGKQASKQARERQDGQTSMGRGAWMCVDCVDWMMEQRDEQRGLGESGQQPLLFW
jgi:hypothetical protein